MMSKKSTTCIGSRTGEPLTEYWSRTEAQESAHYGSIGTLLTKYTNRDLKGY
jgi:hypothetical protein